jgi:hypothetical protein
MKSVQELSNPIGCLQNESSLDKGAIELLGSSRRRASLGVGGRDKTQK